MAAVPPSAASEGLAVLREPRAGSRCGHVLCGLLSQWHRVPTRGSWAPVGGNPGGLRARLPLSAPISLGCGAAGDPGRCRSGGAVPGPCLGSEVRPSCGPRWLWGLGGQGQSWPLPGPPLPALALVSVPPPPSPTSVPAPVPSPGGCLFMALMCPLSFPPQLCLLALPTPSWLPSLSVTPLPSGCSVRPPGRPPAPTAPSPATACQPPGMDVDGACVLGSAETYPQGPPPSKFPRKLGSHKAKQWREQRLPRGAAKRVPCWAGCPQS